LNLSATLLNEVKEQQVRDVLQFIVTRMCAQVQNFGHRRSSSSLIKPALFIAESSLFHNAPKGGGACLYKEALPCQSHQLTLNYIAITMAYGDRWFAFGGNVIGVRRQLTPAKLVFRGLQYYFEEGG
jgi:hypothetical protein